MFTDRDLTLLGAGAIIAVLCLFLPISFTAKIIVGFAILGIFMFLALWRVSPDRVPIETWLRRRIAFAMKTRLNTFQQGNSGQPASTPPVASRQPTPATPQPAPAPAPAFTPVSMAWSEVGIYPMVTAFLSVIGIYFLYWLATGGAAETAQTLKLFLR